MNTPPAPPPRRAPGGFTLIELLLAATLVVLAALVGAAYVTRGTQHADWTRDRMFARERAISILAELRAYVEGGEGEAAADLDGFDDGVATRPELTITPDPEHPGDLLAPDHPLSGNVMDLGTWRWSRRITVRAFPGVTTRDLRVCTVRVFRRRPGMSEPGDPMAEVSSVIRTIGDAYPTTQVYDVYLLALDNVPGWWVYMDAIQPFVEATLADLSARNPGLSFRTHWITRLAYGRDREYAPYTNEERDSRATTPWAYVYPGRMPDGLAAQRYYVADRMQGRVNVDGQVVPSFRNETSDPEPYVDDDHDGFWDPGERFTDVNRNGRWDPGNPLPYALADMHNHAMRWPEEHALFAARVAAQVETEDVPTWRLLLDRMVAEPDRYHNAILINLHGELLPMPPARNVSDPARSPVTRPGWRAVTHPERLRPARVPGDDAQSDAPRFRVYAYKASFENAEVLMSQEEPFADMDHDGAYDVGETFTDWNGDGVRDAGLPISIAIRDGDFSGAPNAASDPSIRVLCLPGGVDADGDGSPDPYRAWAAAPCLPEAFADANHDGVRQVEERWLDLDGDGGWDAGEPWQEMDGDGRFSPAEEGLTDANANGRWDPARPAESFTDANANGRWDPAEPFWDVDGDGTWTPPVVPVTPRQPWNPAHYHDPLATALYVAAYGEPFLDLDGDDVWDAAEDFLDADGDGVRGGGFERGEMWFEIAWDATGRRTVLRLHGTPLETPYVDNAENYRKGLPTACRLYDLDYVPCPTPDTADAGDRFGRDLAFSSSSVPKNTARWTIELPLASVRRAFATAPGRTDGDAADRIVALETRIGRSLQTGTMWPTRNDPPNLSTTYAYFYGDPEDVPFSERYQFTGDPRHMPYLDLDARGTTVLHGYNWYWDDFRNSSYDTRSLWQAFDTARLRDGWKGRTAHDVGRLMSWLRAALVRSEAVYTTLTGFSYYYLSLGADVGYDADNGFASSIPMDGTPFGLSGSVYENTITTEIGTSSLRGSLKHVRSNTGANNGIRAGGYWWSKPWLGELCPDGAYEAQWVPWGNLRAAGGTGAGTFRLVRRADVPSAQQPRGTTLVNSMARLNAEGCVSFFNIGNDASHTFHHQYKTGSTGALVDDGPQLAEKYNFPLPQRTDISRPFGLSTSGDGGVGDEFAYTDAYPRYSAATVRRYYNHSAGQTGSALVRLQTPSADRAAYVVVNGIDRTIESGSAFISRFATLSLIHSFFAAGVPESPNRVHQLPRVQVRSPTIVTELNDPQTIEVQWSTEWRRWDGLPYTQSYPEEHAEDEANLVYRLLYSRDGGRTWLHMLDGSPAELGVLPWVEGVGPDPDVTLRDVAPAENESWFWPTPDDEFPEGSYLIRVETYRSSEALHYAQHVEKIYVNR